MGKEVERDEEVKERVVLEVELDEFVVVDLAVEVDWENNGDEMVEGAEEVRQRTR